MYSLKSHLFLSVREFIITEVLHTLRLYFIVKIASVRIGRLYKFPANDLFNGVYKRHNLLKSIFPRASFQQNPWLMGTMDLQTGVEALVVIDKASLYEFSYEHHSCQ